MITVYLEQRFTIPGYETFITSIDGERFRVEFVNEETDKVNDSYSFIVYAKLVTDHTGHMGVATSSVPFSK